MLRALREWWSRPPARERLLASLSHEWQAPLDIIRKANMSIGGFYSRIIEMEREGLVDSKWDEGPIPASRRGRRRRLYRLAN